MTPEQHATAAAELLRGKAKPPGSLGMLEDVAIRLCELQGTLAPRVTSARLILFVADHGVTLEAPEVSAYPRQVTPAMFGAIARGQAASSALARAAGADLEIVDVGVDADLPGAGARGGDEAPGPAPAGRGHPGKQAAARLPREASLPATHVAHAKVARGSSSFLRGPAMTAEQCRSAMDAGAAAVVRACKSASAAGGAAVGAAVAGSGGLVVAIGELGIGNTTAASALVAALTGAAADAVVGRGTGVDDAGLAAKQRAVAAALEANATLIAGGGALGALQAAGGLELAAMAGAFMEAARRRLPAIVDGFVSGAAALAAARIDPSVRSCLFASHRSAEAAAGLVLDELGLVAPLHMGMRLGEGTGAVLALPLLRSAAAIMTDMASLEEVMAAALEPDE